MAQNILQWLHYDINGLVLKGVRFFCHVISSWQLASLILQQKSKTSAKIFSHSASMRNYIMNTPGSDYFQQVEWNFYLFCTYQKKSLVMGWTAFNWTQQWTSHLILARKIFSLVCLPNQGHSVISQNVIQLIKDHSSILWLWSHKWLCKWHHADWRALCEKQS